MADVRVGGSNPSLIPDPNITPRDYPKNPAPMPGVNPGPARGEPQDVPTIAQGISLMVACSVCGLSYRPDQLGTHMREEATANANQMFDVDNGAVGDDDLDDNRFNYKPAKNP